MKFGEGEDHPEDEFVEPKFEMIPGTLEHITELMVEKVVLSNLKHYSCFFSISGAESKATSA